VALEVASFLQVAAVACTRGEMPKSARLVAESQNC